MSQAVPFNHRVPPPLQRATDETAAHDVVCCLRLVPAQAELLGYLDAEPANERLLQLLQEVEEEIGAPVCLQCRPPAAASPLPLPSDSAVRALRDEGTTSSSCYS